MSFVPVPGMQQDQVQIGGDALNQETIASTLDNAAKHIEDHGWCRGALKTQDGKVCLIGALLSVTADLWNKTAYVRKSIVNEPEAQANYRLFLAAKTELIEYLGFNPGNYSDEYMMDDLLVDFNDSAFDRHVVTELLRKTAIRVREQA